LRPIEYEVMPDKGDVLIGQEMSMGDDGKSFFVKAKFSDGTDSDEAKVQYLLTHIEGIQYFYDTLDECDVWRAVGGGIVDVVSQRSLGMSHEEDGDVWYSAMCSRFGLTEESKIPVREALKACTDQVARQALRSAFPGIDIGSVMLNLQEMVSGAIESIPDNDFFQLLLENHSESEGIFFEVVLDSDQAESGEFPQALGSLAMLTPNFIKPEHLKLGRWSPKYWSRTGRAYKLDRATLEPMVAKDSHLGKKLNSLQPHEVLTAYFSVVRDITLPDEDRKQRGIPEGAVYFVWSYPFFTDWDMPDDDCTGSSTDCPDMAFLRIGGFIYLDASYKPIHILAATPSAEGGLKFGRPKRMAQKWVEKLLYQDQFQPVTLQFLLEKGTTDFCWIAPEEEVMTEDPGKEATVASCQYGGFAYIGLASIAARRSRTTERSSPKSA